MWAHKKTASGFQGRFDWFDVCVGVRKLTPTYRLRG